MKILHNQRGAALITALVILALLTIIGLAATNTSTLETMISATEKTHSEAFYAAEAGIDHLRRNFKDLFIDKNNNKFAAGADPDWDFALIGQDGVAGTADDASGESYQQGARWITDRELGNGYKYNVTVWDNNDGGTSGNEYRDDTDGVIYLRADAQVPGGGTASIEILLHGDASGGSSISGYSAQEGGGSGKSYSSNDVDAVKTFQAQIQ